MSRQPARRPVRVAEYDEDWPRQFEELRERISAAVSDVAVAIEHVGSTSVPGLAAKPVIDLDIVIGSPNDLSRVVTRLAGIGYAHLGDLGIEGREAFAAAEDRPPHNLYVCADASIPLCNHLTIRDHLRNHEPDRAAYSDLKKRLAAEHSNDIDAYVHGKTEFLLGVLVRYGFSDDVLNAVRRANQR